MPFATANPNGVIQASSLPLTLYAQADGVSASVNDTMEVTLEAWDGQAVPGCSKSLSLTAIDIPIEIYSVGVQSNTGPVPPLPLCDPGQIGACIGDKVNTGRFLHVQEPGNREGRALITVGPVSPTGLPGTAQIKVDLVNRGGGALQLFGSDTGGTPITTPALYPANVETQLWAEGMMVSTNVPDTEVHVGMDGVASETDKVAATVVQFSNLVVTLPTTQPLSTELGQDGPNQTTGNAAVPPQQLTVGGGWGTNAFDDTFDNNAPLVLLSGTLTAGNPPCVAGGSGSCTASLAVQIAPPSVPVSWSVLRDEDPGTGDDPSLEALGPQPVPTLGTTTGTTTTLLSDSVGSFRVRAFVDVNGDNQFDEVTDPEPFAVLNLVLVQVKQIGSDRSALDATQLAASFRTDPNDAGAFQVSSGDNQQGSLDNLTTFAGQVRARE